MTETDQEFLDRLLLDWTLSCPDDFRLFALARRGAAATVEDELSKISNEHLTPLPPPPKGETEPVDRHAIGFREGAAHMQKAQAAEIERLLTENASLASWQCEFTDGKTGLVYGDGGSTYCAMAKEVERLREALRSSRAEVLEEAARVAEGLGVYERRTTNNPYSMGRLDVADAIRALKEKPLQ